MRGESMLNAHSGLSQLLIIKSYPILSYTQAIPSYFAGIR